MSGTLFTGVIPILATPFNDDESLDLESWTRLLEFMVRLRVNGVTIIGVLGESNRLTDDERDRLISRAVEVVHGRLPIIVGTSHSGTLAARTLAHRAAALGANAVMIAPGKEAVPNDERIVSSYRRIADGLHIPIVLQDHPASTEVHMSVALMLRLVGEVSAIQCIKAEAVPTAPKFAALRAGMSNMNNGNMNNRAIPILTGLGALYAPFDLQAGSSGFNTGFAFPEILMAMVAAAQAADWARVHAIYARFATLIVFEQQPGVAVRKEILRRRGLLDSSRARHPGTTITPFVAAQLDQLLAHLLPGMDITQPLLI